MILIAILAPWLSFLLRGKFLSAFVAFIVELIAAFSFFFFGLSFFVVWFILAAWAVMSYNNAKADKRNRELMKLISQSNRP